jgi:hypothetical protein
VRWAGHVAHIEDMRNAYKVVFGKHEGKRPLGRFKLKRDNTHTHTHTHNTYIHTYIHTYISWILKPVIATIRCGISHKDTKHTDKCSNNKTKVQKQNENQ